MTATTGSQSCIRPRVVNFTDVTVQSQALVLDPSTDLDELVASIRRYTDLPMVFLISANQSAIIAKLLAKLSAIRSPCYPYAVFVVSGDGDGAVAFPDDPEVEVIDIASRDSEQIDPAIEQFARRRFSIDRESLKFPNAAALPERVDILIVGAGATGLYAGNRFKDTEHSFCIVDARDEIGGIWSRFANATSQVNTSEGAYRMLEPATRTHRDHSFAFEMLEDVATLARGVSSNLYTETRVESVEKIESGYRTTVVRGGEKHVIESEGVLLAINDRVGASREVVFDGEDEFQGTIVRGISDETSSVDWAGKRVVVVGMGAFAVENARTALEAGAEHVTVVCRRHGTVCPKIIDYLNFATPYNERFEHDRKSNIRNMMLWKRLYDGSGATEPECWMGMIKHTGHTISVSDIWFVAHHLGKLETVTGSIASMQRNGVTLTDGTTIDADIVVKCVGFHRNASSAVELTGYREMYNTNYLDDDLMYLADAFLDDDVFNSFFGSSVLEMAKFYLEVYLAMFRNDSMAKMQAIEGVEKIPIEDRAWSHYIAGADALIAAYPEFRTVAEAQIEQRLNSFLETHDLETYIAANKREWMDMHRDLAGRELSEDEYLPYVFEKLVAGAK